jgi:hypothetical protein
MFQLQFFVLQDVEKLSLPFHPFNLSEIVVTLIVWIGLKLKKTMRNEQWVSRI